ERTPTDPELLGGRGLVAAHLSEYARDLIALRRGHQRGIGAITVEACAHWCRLMIRRRDRHRARDLALGDDAVVAQNAGALDDIPQLPDISGPRRLMEQAFRCRRDAFD